jgi:hypothetical protein
VSLLWRSRKMRVALCPDRLILSGGKIIPVERTNDDAEWRGAVTALSEILKSGKKQELSIVLADSFVRYALLPYSAAIKTEEQWLALARHRLTAVHGARVAEWELRVADTAPAAPRLVCALDRELIAALSSKVAEFNVNLASVQPFLVAAFNQIRKQIDSRMNAGSCWLVVEEPGRLTLALIQRGVWVAIRSRRVEANWRELLPEILEREGAFLALAEPCTRVMVCAQGSFDTDLHEAWRAQALSYPELATAWE